MKEISPAIGHRIQKIRLRQHRTLEEVAVQCGFTKSLLSKIEHGKTAPPIATLMKIAAVLGVDITHFLAQTATFETVHTPAAALADSKLTMTEKGYRFHMFAGQRSEKLMQPFLFVARKGEVQPSALSHRGEEFVYVLSGEMSYRVGDLNYRLGPGDSLYFDSEQAHDLAPISVKVVYLGVFSDVHNAAPKIARHRSRDA
jgi:transcriptional regulator with XRE-family HTH domain